MLRICPGLLVMVLGFLAGACGGDMAAATHVVNLRVLAIRADPPEVRAPEGDAVAETSMDALVVGEEGAVSYSWRLCFVPGIVTDGQPCLDPSTEIALGQGRSATIPVPSAQLLLAQAPPELQGFEIDLSSGVPIQVQLDVTDESGRVLTALKTILISSREEPNTNPVLEGLSLDGEPWEAGEIVEVADTATELEMVPQWPEAAQEPYDDDGVPTTESLLFSWFIDDETSELGKARSSEAVPANTFTPGAFEDDDEEPERLVTLWLVARDDRGGVTWLTRQLRLVRGE